MASEYPNTKEILEALVHDLRQSIETIEGLKADAGPHGDDQNMGITYNEVQDARIGELSSVIEMIEAEIAGLEPPKDERIY